MQSNEADILIIRRVRAGEISAFAMIVDRYQQYVFTLVLRYVSSREQAEELCQDTFLKAYNHLQDFRQESKFSTWLYTIAHTTCLSHIRKKPTVISSAEDSQLQLLVTCATDDDHRSEQRSQKKMIDAAIGLLSPGDAELLTLYYQAEQSIVEIAFITGTAANNIKVKLHRARIKLKTILIKHFSSDLVHLNHAEKVNHRL